MILPPPGFQQPIPDPSDARRREVMEKLMRVIRWLRDDHPEECEICLRAEQERGH